MDATKNKHGYLKCSVFKDTPEKDKKKRRPKPPFL
jgi:hypothetical protein